MDCQTVAAASGAQSRATDNNAVVAVLLGAITTVLDWQERASQRRQLSGLGPALLKDRGIDPASAAREAAKPFWRR